jgi:hypothetical protein
MSCVATWYDGSSHVVEIADLTDGLTDALLSSGVTVTAIVVAYGDDDALGSCALSPVNGIPGTWRGVFSATVELTPGGDYELIVTADGGEFATRVWRIGFPVARGEAASGS